METDSKKIIIEKTDSAIEISRKNEITFRRISQMLNPLKYYFLFVLGFIPVYCAEAIFHLPSTFLQT